MGLRVASLSSPGTGEAVIETGLPVLVTGEGLATNATAGARSKPLIRPKWGTFSRTGRRTTAQVSINADWYNTTRVGLGLHQARRTRDRGRFNPASDQGTRLGTNTSPRATARRCIMA